VPGDLDFHHAAVGVDELTPGMPVREDEPLEPNFVVGAALVSSEILLGQWLRLVSPALGTMAGLSRE
jgi:hypothetical protein